MKKSVRGLDTSDVFSGLSAILVTGSVIALLAGTSSLAATITYDTTQLVSTRVNDTTSKTTVNIAAGSIITFTVPVITNTRGGAVYAAGDLSFNGGDVVFKGNQTSYRGGAVDAKSVTFTGNVTFDDNHALYDGLKGGVGGALYTSNGSVSIGGNLILTNNSSSHTDTPLASGGGGGLFVTVGSLTVGGTTYATGNESTGNGGALYVNSGNITLEGNAVFNDNHALGFGGAIFSAVGTNVVIFNGTASFDGNTGQGFGGAMDSVNIYFNKDATFTNNSVSSGVGRGGAVYATGTTEFNGFTIFTGNSASGSNGSGGALFSNQASTFTAGAEVTGNTASGNGGAIYANRNLSFATGAGHSVFSGNRSNYQGGAVFVGNSLILNADGADIEFTGNTHGVATTAAANAIYLNNGNGTSSATFNAEAGRRISFYDPITSYASNGLLSVIKTGAGIVSFDGSRQSLASDRWSNVYASTDVQAGIFEVANNAVYGVHAADVGSSAETTFTTALGSTLQGGVAGTVLADQFTLGGALNIAGDQTSVRGVFTVDSNQVSFASGSTVIFNTYLNDGVTQNSDLLILNLNGSATSGQANILVNNIGGLGALTVGDGIKLVQTNDGTSHGAFMLGAPVLAGAYEYFLYHGGNAATGGDVNDQNWYLRSETQDNVLPPTDGVVDPAQPPAIVTVPSYRPEVPLVSAIMPIGLQYGYAMLDTLHERVGDTFEPPFTPTTEQYYVKDKLGQRQLVKVEAKKREREEWFYGAWARFIGDHHSRDRGRSYNFEKNGPNYEFDIFGVQAGLDLYGRVKQDGTLDKLGIYVGYGQVDARVDGAWSGKAGSIDMDNYTIGGYWTHHDADGWYTDAIVQGTWYDVEGRSIYGLKEKTNGFGIIASLEGGYKFDLGNGYTIEPQAQIAYQNLSFDKINDGRGRFDMTGGESLRGRIGVRLTKEWNVEEDRRKQPRMIKAWIRANVWHEFMGKTKTTVTDIYGYNPVSIRSPLNGTWGELGLGVSGQVSERMTVFATGSYNRSLDNRGYEAWDGRLGITYKW
ncbi:autotransporter outer membrane beta-barrel domain-containing protein [Microvirga sp. W0021]|uniref:Autotransporter outer membrane beta-barrel domain-containing protein n=1 Tax=Hohaiivirga grylli TaxID=3133970 RepID=A0ABV0BLA1_9HYPH